MMSDNEKDVKYLLDNLVFNGTPLSSLDGKAFMAIRDMAKDIPVTSINFEIIHFEYIRRLKG